MSSLMYTSGVSHNVALTNSAVKITTQMPYGMRRGVVIQNIGAGTAYLGFSDAVSSINGLALAADEKISIDGAVTLWAISASTSDLRVWELS